MFSLNKVELVGNCGTDGAIVAHRINGTAVGTFKMATSESFFDKEKTEWHYVVCLGKLAEFVANNIKTGMLVYVSGSLQTRDITTKDGVQFKRTEILADSVQYITKPLKDFNKEELAKITDNT